MTRLIQAQSKLSEKNTKQPNNKKKPAQKIGVTGGGAWNTRAPPGTTLFKQMTAEDTRTTETLLAAP